MHRDREQRREWESAEATENLKKKKNPISASRVDAFGRGLQFHRLFLYHIPLTNHTFTKIKRFKISRGPTSVKWIIFNNSRLPDLHEESSASAIVFILIEEMRGK